MDWFLYDKDLRHERINIYMQYGYNLGTTCSLCADDLLDTNFTGIGDAIILRSYDFGKTMLLNVTKCFFFQIWSLKSHGRI